MLDATDGVTAAARNARIAREIMDTGAYVVLATADADGVPWATPVWFAHDDYRELYWVSAPGTRHSLNLAARPELSMVVFDSTAAPNQGQAVYLSGTAARQTDEAAVERGMAVFSRAAVAAGMAPWGVDRVTGDARLRLYRATVTEHHILDPDATIDVRVAVNP